MTIQVWKGTLSGVSGDIMFANGDDASQSIDVIRDMKVSKGSGSASYITNNIGDLNPYAILITSAIDVVTGFLGIEYKDNTYYGKKMHTFIDGHGGNDTISSGQHDDTVYGGLGNDYIQADKGNDLVYGGRGTVDTEDGSDYIDAASGNDTVYGNAGNDTINGGAGNDFLCGGRGNNMLTGGTGSDVFYYAGTSPTAPSRDTITDFKQRDGDKINLHDIITNTPSLANVQHLTFIGSAAFNNIAQVRFDSVAHVLSVNVDANFSTAELSIQLTGVSSLSLSDFVL